MEFARYIQPCAEALRIFEHYALLRECFFYAFGQLGKGKI